MAEEQFNLSKNVISNKKAQELYDGAFNEIALSAEKVDDKKLKKIYDELFYQIPKRGEDSHEHIIIQSHDIKYPEVNENLEDEIPYMYVSFSNIIFTSIWIAAILAIFAVLNKKKQELKEYDVSKDV